MTKFHRWTAEEIAALPEEAVMALENGARVLHVSDWHPGLLADEGPLALIWPQPEPEQYHELHDGDVVEKGSRILVRWERESVFNVTRPVRLDPGDRAFLIAPAPDPEAEKRAERVRKVAEALLEVGDRCVAYGSSREAYAAMADAAVAAMEAGE